MSNFQKSLDPPVSHIDNQAADVNIEISGLPKVSSRERLNNSARQKKPVFRYLANRVNNIALQSIYFHDEIRAWMGYVYECFILHSKSLNNLFWPFRSTETFCQVNESDEEGMTDRSGKMWTGYRPSP